MVRTVFNVIPGWIPFNVYAEWLLRAYNMDLFYNAERNEFEIYPTWWMHNA